MFWFSGNKNSYNEKITKFLNLLNSAYITRGFILTYFVSNIAKLSLVENAHFLLLQANICFIYICMHKIIEAILLLIKYR